MAVRRIDGAVERVGKALHSGGWDLARLEERERGRRRGRARDRALLESPLDGRDGREERLRVRQVPSRRPLRRIEQLPDAAREPIVKDAVPAADDAAAAVGEGGADARLEVVQVGLLDVARRILFEVVPKAVGERETR